VKAFRGHEAFEPFKSPAPIIACTNCDAVGAEFACQDCQNQGLSLELSSYCGTCAYLHPKIKASRDHLLVSSASTSGSRRFSGESAINSTMTGHQRSSQSHADIEQWATGLLQFAMDYLIRKSSAELDLKESVVLFAIALGFYLVTRFAFGRIAIVPQVIGLGLLYRWLQRDAKATKEKVDMIETHPVGKVKYSMVCCMVCVADVAV
jgi:hypothetical protein